MTTLTASDQKVYGLSQKMSPPTAVSNFCGASFCLTQPIGGLLVKEIRPYPNETLYFEVLNAGGGPV